VPGVAVGTLLAVRRPRNLIGWLLLAFLFLSVAPWNDYAILDYRMHHGTLPLGWLAVLLLNSWPNRARYDAEMVIAAFTARLRQTVDLDTAQSDLVDAVHQAFEPAHVSVWLAEATTPGTARRR
jgi:hypothetical protein